MLGKTISHYRILEKLGEGGMGVVYKAEDTKLDRLVALKFLPQSLTVTETDRARFLQEAKAAAAINHPNVCVIYDIQEHVGQQFIVMEYVEGETLAEKIKQQKANIKPLLDWAIEIASGLEAAHEKGIVHRDVKSENIMVNTKNQIKVMDFGLAKLKGALKLTKTSSTVGTIAYMSPEQLQGVEADARTDIFSFGVVLYEMLTKNLPFRGEYEAALMYSIVNEEPEPVQKYRPELPSEFLHVLNRALEKHADERYQSVSDMIIDLRRLKKETGRVSRQLPGEMKISESRAAMAAPRSLQKKWWLSLGALAVLAIVVSVLLLLPQRSPELNPNMTFRVLEIPFTQISYPGLSRDGNWVAFLAAEANGKWDVYFMNTSGGEPRRITADSSDYMLSVDVSPDGARVIYDRWSYRLRKTDVCIVSSLGGTSKVVVSLVSAPLWRPDGERIGYILGHPFAFTASKSGRLEFWSSKPDGSDNRLEFVDSTIPEINTRAAVSWSPDGKSIAWIRTFPEGHTEVIVRELETGKERQLTFDKKMIDEVCWTPNDQITRFPSWSPDGRWIVYSARSISAPVDSAGVYLVEASSLANPSLLGRGSGRCFWIDPRSFIVFTSSNSWLFSVDGTTPKRISEDSTFALPVFGEKHVLLEDLRKGREGWWMASTADWRAPATRPPKKILGLGPRLRFALAPSREVLYYVKNVGELRKITLPDGKEQRLPGTFPFLKSDFSVSHDDQEIVWVDRRTQGKLVMIENLFK